MPYLTKMTRQDQRREWRVIARSRLPRPQGGPWSIQDRTRASHQPDHHPAAAGRLSHLGTIAGTR